MDKVITALLAFLLSLLALDAIANTSVTSDKQSTVIPHYKVALLDLPNSENNVNQEVANAISYDHLKYLSFISNFKLEAMHYSTISDILQAVKNKQVDIGLDFSVTPKRQEQFIFSQPLYIQNLVTWYRDIERVNSDTKSTRWVCIKNTIYCGVVEKYKHKTIEVNSFTDALNLIDSEQADAMIAPYPRLLRYLNDNNITYGHIALLDKHAQEALSAMTAIGNQHIIDKINLALKADKNSTVASWKNKLTNIYKQADQALFQFLKRNKNYSQRIIRYSIDDNLPPLFYRASNGKLHGYLYDFIQFLSNRTGLTFLYVHKKNNQTLDQMLYNNEIDFVPIASLLSKHSDRIMLTHPYMTSRYFSIHSPYQFISNSEKIGIYPKQTIQDENTPNHINYLYTQLEQALTDLGNKEISKLYFDEDVLDKAIKKGINDNYIIDEKDDIKNINTYMAVFS